ncbi:MAG: ModD protein [Sulfurimonas sp.]
MRLSDQTLLEYIREDIPYFDLTTHILDPKNKQAVLSIKTRENIVVACVEEALRIGELLGCRGSSELSSGDKVEAGGILLEFEGDAQTVHQVWKAAQILLEYSCGIATTAKSMADKVKNINPKCEVLVTRKSFPFAKQFVIRSLLCADVLPHRLGLSESVLIFDNHRALYDTPEAFEAALLKIKERCVEKKLVIESETFEDAKKMLSLGADVIQMDKVEPQELQRLVDYKTKHYPQAKILAAGGININNADLYATTGIDAIVTSSLYSSPLADLTSELKIL